MQQFLPPVQAQGPALPYRCRQAEDRGDGSPGSRSDYLYAL